MIVKYRETFIIESVSSPMVDNDKYNRGKVRKNSVNALAYSQLRIKKIHSNVDYLCAHRI